MDSKSEDLGARLIKRNPDECKCAILDKSRASAPLVSPLSFGLGYELSKYAGNLKMLCQSMDVCTQE